jgi:3-deoxy-7-phosphoheptulonate synthase
MLAGELPLSGLSLPQTGTRLVCRSVCRRTRSKPQQTRGFLRQQSIKAVVEPPALPFEKESEHLARWRPDSWKQLKAHQQPKYEDREKLQEAVDTIARMPPLVFAGECRNLQARLAKCATGEAFLVQGRDSFCCSLCLPSVE